MAASALCRGADHQSPAAAAMGNPYTSPTQLADACTGSAPGRAAISGRQATRRARSRVRFDVGIDDRRGLTKGCAARRQRRRGHLLAIPLLSAPATPSGVDDAGAAAAASRVFAHDCLPRPKLEFCRCHAVLSQHGHTAASPERGGVRRRWRPPGAAMFGLRRRRLTRSCCMPACAAAFRRRQTPSATLAR